MLSNEQQRNTLLDLFHQGVRRTYDKGEFIIRPGESPPGVFYLEDGLVKSYDITKYGEENLLIVRKQGEVLALTWAITGEERDIIYTAIAPTTVWQISREQFVDFLHENSEAALPLLEMVTDMYRWHSQHIISLEYRSVRERLVAFLLIMSRRFGTDEPNGRRISVPLRHQDIASSINSSRETTSRELAVLHRKGLVDSEQSIITLRDLPALNSFLS